MSSGQRERRERTRLGRVGAPLRIAMLAPPWIPIPPPAYGGIEHVVALLSDELVRRGHEVTLFAAPGSRSAAIVRSPLSRPYPRQIGQALYEADHVARAFAEIEDDGRRAFDVVHDHSGFTALALANRVSVPMVHTLHGPFTGDTSGFYAEHGDRAALVAISDTQLRDAPAGLRVSAVIPNPIAADVWPLRYEKDDYLLWVGRMTEGKGPHRAIEAARRAGRPLLIAGPVQPGQEAFFASEIEPQLDGRRVRYLGEVGGRAKTELFARASALLMPIRWPEPFGMVMIEALVCGTPVIAFPEGAASEVVLHAENGFHVCDETEMALAVERIGAIDPASCRASVEGRYHVGTVAAAYEAVYRRAISSSTTSTLLRAPRHHLVLADARPSDTSKPRSSTGIAQGPSL
ncbi:MAG TPA: glycosyltransferase family 4 protein [Solirubrobacterales bacterium]|nr:glycosyltransferase family 4 protein [Solirubrobacterales bacterium]